MDDILNTFGDLIISIEMDDEIENVNQVVIKLKDNSELAVFEKMNTLGEKYSYHWMSNDKKLLIRWDNAKHHPNLDNYPFHKHIGTTKNVEPSEKMTLRKVLKKISTIIAFILIISLLVYLIK